MGCWCTCGQTGAGSRRRAPHQTRLPNDSLHPLALVQLLVLPAVEELQRGEETRWRWVNYSAFDAKVRDGMGRLQPSRRACCVLDATTQWRCGNWSKLSPN